MPSQRFFLHLLASSLVFIHPICSAAISRNFIGGSNVVLSQDLSEKYAVIFDAGSTGSRVHVFHFDEKLDLLQIGQDFEFFETTKPGLSSFAEHPEGAAASLKPLLEKAEAIVPEDLRPITPVKVGATAGLRFLDGNTAEEILEAVRDLIKNESSLKFETEWVDVLEGSQEAAYLWAALNFLAGTAGKSYSETVGTIDLGGGSLEMTYAVKASQIPTGLEKYVQEMHLRGTTYQLYAYSYLNYGLLAARAAILNVSGNHSHPCIPYGYEGYYTYNGVAHRVSALPFGANIKRCTAFVLKTLKLDAPCEHKNCTFNGVWNGGGGNGQKNLYAASFFYDIPSEVGIVDPKVPSGIARPVDFKAVAKRACRTKYKDMDSVFPNIDVRDKPMICMDLVYQYTLLVNGLGLNPFQNITLVKEIKYKNSLIEAAWPLGSAIEAVSLLKFKEKHATL